MKATIDLLHDLLSYAITNETDSEYKNSRSPSSIKTKLRLGFSQSDRNFERYCAITLPPSSVLRRQERE